MTAPVLPLIASTAAALALQGQDQFQVAPPQEGISAPPLLLVAYAIVWMVLIVYVYLLWRRADRIDRDLATVAQTLRERQR